MKAQVSTMSTADYNDISQRVDNIEGLVNQIEQGQKEGFRKLFLEIESLKKDNSLTIDGDTRHNVRPVREIAEEALKHSKETLEDAVKKDRVTNERIDKILWLVAGISLGSGIGGATLMKLIFGI